MTITFGFYRTLDQKTFVFLLQQVNDINVVSPKYVKEVLNNTDECKVHIITELTESDNEREVFKLVNNNHGTFFVCDTLKLRIVKQYKCAK